jgi:hypothetical protein
VKAVAQKIEKVVQGTTRIITAPIWKEKRLSTAFSAAKTG